MKPLFIPLHTRFFEQFKNGEKQAEYRVFGKRWNFETCFPGRDVVLSKGYGKKDRLFAVVDSCIRVPAVEAGAVFNRLFPDADHACIIYLRFTK